jgi:hypothetical protein
MRTWYDSAQGDIGIILRANGSPNNCFASSRSKGTGWSDTGFGITVRRNPANFLQCSSAFANAGIVENEWVWAMLRIDTSGANSDQQAWYAPLRNPTPREPSSYSQQQTGSGALDDPHNSSTEIWSQWSGSGPECAPAEVAFLGWWNRYLSVAEFQQFMLTGRVPYHDDKGAGMFFSGAPQTYPPQDYRGLGSFIPDSGSLPDDERPGRLVRVPWSSGARFALSPLGLTVCALPIAVDSKVGTWQDEASNTSDAELLNSVDTWGESSTYVESPA